jgi:DNA-binding winged helix-turn-helix (wHTH) protein/tetratricopeptide (TPR) repeat protein
MATADDTEARPPIDLAEEIDFRLGRAHVRPALGEVVCGDTRVVLQRRIMQVLVVLASADGAIVSRDELITRCWGQVSVGEDALNRCIQRLRQLSVEMPDTFRIETRLRVGYRLLSAPAAGETGTTAGPASRRSLRVRLALGGVAALAAATAVAAALGLVGRAPRGGVAIEPFAITDGGALAQRFAAGAVYATAGALADADVKVVEPGRPSSERRAEFVLDGRAGLHQGRIDLDVELVDARDGQVLWSKGFERAATLSEPLQEQVAAKLADVLHCALDTSKYGGRPIDRSVLKLYLRACDLQRDATARGEVRNLFRQVTEQEPRFAYGWSHLAFAAANDAFILSADDAEAARRQAQAAAQTALRLNPKDGLAYEALADLGLGRTSLAHIYGLFQRGLAVDPDNPDLLEDEGELMLRVGRVQDSIALLHRSLALDPLAPDYLAALVDALIDAGRLGEARAELARGLRLWPDNEKLKSDYVSLALRDDPPQPTRFGADPALRQTNISDAMQASNQRLLAVRAAPTLTHLHAFVAAELADLQAARLSPDRVILDLTTVGETAPALQVAMRLGTGDAAYRVPQVDPEILWRPFAESFRRDPRFIDVARRLGLVDFWMSTGRWPDFCERLDLSYACKLAQPAKRVARDEQDGRGQRAGVYRDV